MYFRMGLFLGLGLITSIGAQNLFIIKQSIKREAALYCALLCFVCDAILIGLSITTTQQLLLQIPLLKTGLLMLAVVFLVWYGGQSFLSAWRGDSVAFEKTFKAEQSYVPYRKLFFISIGFSLLNPNAIVDTMILIGGIANNYPLAAQYEFALGAVTASFLWFFGLVVILRYLGRYLQTPLAWRIVESISGCVMFLVAIHCLQSLL